MERKYEHLSAEERATIMIETERGASLRSIARLLDRSPSTISRELTRGRPCPASRYRAAEAAGRYRQRRRASVRPRKLVEGNGLWQRVRDGLCYRFWSPHQIAARLRLMHPDDSERQVSAETIYRAIYAHPRGPFKAEMVAALRQAKPSRGRRRTTAASTGGFVPEPLRIGTRPGISPCGRGQTRSQSRQWAETMRSGSSRDEAASALASSTVWPGCQFQGSSSSISRMSVVGRRCRTSLK